MSRDPVDRLLDEWKLGPPSPDLASHIVAASRTVPQLPARQGWAARLGALLTGTGGGMRLAPQLAGLGIALMVGFWYGAAGINGSVAQEIDAGALILGPNLESEWLG